LFLDLSTKLRGIRDLETGARGGMVASLFRVTDGLAALGFSVAVLSDIQAAGTTPAGVRWLGHGDEDLLYSTRWDALVCNRGAARGYDLIRARRRILWTHDLPHNGFIPYPKVMAAFDLTVFMSRYAEGVWRTFYRTIGRSARIPNGVDREIFQPDWENKDPYRLIYFSAPNRGLSRLPLIFEAARTRLKSKRLRLTAFSNMKALHPNEVRGESDGYELEYKSAREAGIDLRDPVPQRELARELGRSGVLVLPSGYPEICSNAVLQALACGAPVVTTGGLGATPEWVKSGKNGLLTVYRPADYMVYTVEMVRHLTGLLGDEGRYWRMARAAARTRTVWTWEKVVKRWARILQSTCFGRPRPQGAAAMPALAGGEESPA